jgi:transposase
MQKRKTFSKEFKLEAVRLLERSDKPAAELARELGVRRNQLYKWKEQLGTKGEDAFPGHGRRAPKDDEITRLKRELERVKEERDILKKAAVDSIGQCNATCSNQGFGGVWYGTTWPSGHDRQSKRRTLASLA